MSKRNKVRANRNVKLEFFNHMPLSKNNLSGILWKWLDSYEGGKNPGLGDT